MSGFIDVNDQGRWKILKHWLERAIIAAYLGLITRETVGVHWYPFDDPESGEFGDLVTDRIDGHLGSEFFVEGVGNVGK
jgi:hypothetical protein